MAAKTIKGRVHTKLELREYQKEAIQKFLERGKGTVKAAPGSGKTIIALAAAQALVMRDGFMKVLVITPTLELVRQWMHFFTEFGFGSAEYDVITYARAARLAPRYDFFSMYGFIIADEMHHMQEGPAFMRILLPIFKAKYALGLSATPPTDPQNPALRVLPVIYEYSLSDSTDQGYAAPIKTVVVRAKLNELERKKYDELTDAIHARIAWCGGFEQAMRSGNKHAMEMKVFITQRKQLTAMADQKFVLLRDIIEQLLGLCDCIPPDEPKPTRVLVWSEYVAALEKARDELNRNGPIAEIVTGETPKKERAARFAAWGTEFPVLLIAKLGEEGIDYPELQHGIVIAGARTTRQNTQRIGRLLRPMPGKIAKLWVIVAEDTMEERLVDLIDDVTAGVNDD